MTLNALRLLSVLFVAVSMSAGFAHLFALPNKIGLPRDSYFTVQQIYRGWAFLGVAVFGALVSTVTLAVMERRTPRVSRLTAIAAACVALSLVVFFTFTFPTNQQTQNWTVMPANWESLRQRWEYSHAVGAILYLIALIALTRSLLVNNNIGR